MAQFARPVICLSSKFVPDDAFTKANGTVAAVVPLENRDVLHSAEGLKDCRP